MKRVFRVDGLVYELRTTRTNEIQLAITGGASPAYRPAYDPFDWDYTPFVTEDVAAVRYPITVTRTALRSIINWIGRTRPPQFSFSARNDRRCRLYRRVGDILATRFPEYKQVEYKRTFYFYRMK